MFLAGTWASYAAKGMPVDPDPAARFDFAQSAIAAAWVTVHHGTGDWSPYSGHCSTAY